MGHDWAANTLSALVRHCNLKSNLSIHVTCAIIKSRNDQFLRYVILDLDFGYLLLSSISDGLIKVMIMALSIQWQIVIKSCLNGWKINVCCLTVKTQLVWTCCSLGLWWNTLIRWIIPRVNFPRKIVTFFFVASTRLGVYGFSISLCKKIMLWYKS